MTYEQVQSWNGDGNVFWLSASTYHSLNVLFQIGIAANIFQLILEVKEKAKWLCDKYGASRTDRG